MISFPTSPEAALDLLARGPATLRAGGTDVVDRTRNGLLDGDVIDLRDIAPGAENELRAVDLSKGLYVGALTRVSQLDTPALAPWNGLYEAARTLANPQIRSLATVGGSLLQANRCWYFRHPSLQAECHKSGGSACSARSGDAIRHALFDTGPCISVHPSTLGCALLAYDAMISVMDAGGVRVLGSIEDLYGPGVDPTRDHQLPAGVLLHGIHVEHPGTERSAYGRATGRVWAEWPLVEATVRVTAAGVVIAVGGVAPVPLRLREAEAVINAGFSVREAVKREGAGRTVLAETAYKLDLMTGLIQHLLDRANGGTP